MQLQVKFCFYVKPYGFQFLDESVYFIYLFFIFLKKVSTSFLVSQCEVSATWTTEALFDKTVAPKLWLRLVIEVYGIKPPLLVSNCTTDERGGLLILSTSSDGKLFMFRLVQSYLFPVRSLLVVDSVRIWGLLLEFFE